MSACASLPVVAGLEGYWPGEGNANDLSGNGNNGVLVDEAGFAAGKFGQAFSLDGVGDYITVPSDSTLDATGPFSISAWFKRDSFGAFHTIVDRGLGVSDPASSYTVRLNPDDRTYFEWEQGGTNTSIASEDTVLDTEWHHIATVFDGSSNQIYLDGALNASAETGLAPTVTAQSFQIGARLRSGPSFDLFFDGLIDEVAFYSRALSVAEVRQLAHCPIVKNGSFEHALDNGSDPLPGVVDPNTGVMRDAFGPPTSADPIYVLNNGSTAVDGWLAVTATDGATTDWVHSDNYAASDGLRSMDLNGTPGPGGVAQFIDVTPGARYRLEFDLAGNPRGLEDPDGDGPLTPPASFDATMQVDILGQGPTRHEAATGFSFTVDGQTPTDPGWERQSWELNAFDPQIRLQLLSTTDPLYPNELIDFGPIVDNVSLVQIGFAGDYNADGLVDAADYTVWRDNLDTTGLTPFSGADGNGDGQVTDADYDIWRDNYGAAFGTALERGAEAVPEPTGIAIAIMAMTCFTRPRNHQSILRGNVVERNSH